MFLINPLTSESVLNPDFTSEASSANAYFDAFQKSLSYSGTNSGATAKLDITPQTVAPIGQTTSAATATGAAANFLSPFAAWFDPVRIATVLFGVLLFAAGIFLLGKGSITGVAVGAAKKLIP